MKKIILPLIIFFIAHLGALAQPRAFEGKTEYQKGDKLSAIIELPYPPNVVQGAIKDNMLKSGVKEEVSRGLQTFKGARLTPTDGEVADLYFKVDRKSRKENTSVVHLIIGRPNENVALRMGDDSFRIQDAKQFLNDMVPSIDAFSLEVGINDQKNQIGKYEKKLKNLEDDQRSIESKIRNLEDKLTQIKKEIELQTSELEKQRAVRDAMELRRVAKP